MRGGEGGGGAKGGEELRGKRRWRVGRRSKGRWRRERRSKGR